MKVTTESKTDHMPEPNFGQVINRLAFPDLREGHLGENLFELVVKKTNSTDVHVSDIWQGPAELEVDHRYYSDLALLEPKEVGKGYAFSFAFTLQSLEYDL